MKLRFKLFIFTLLSVLVLASATTFASVGETPPANAEISNQATLEYITGTGEHRTVVSNIVITLVNPVYGVDIDPPIHQTGKTGELIYYVHTVQNIGNVKDDFRISVTDLDANYGNITGGDGTNYGQYRIMTYGPTGLKVLPDSTIKGLAKGASTGVIIAVKGTAADATQGEFKVHAQSIGAEDVGRQVKDYVKDNLTTSAKAILHSYKGFSEGYAEDGATIGTGVSEGPVAKPFMATFYFHNSGGEAAGVLSLTDDLDDRFQLMKSGYTADGKNMAPNYSIGGAPAVNLTFGDNSGDVKIKAENTNTRVTIDVASGLLTNKTAAQTLQGMDLKVSFWLQAKPGTLAGTIPNQGSYTYEDQTTGGETKKGNTNITTYTVEHLPGIVFEGEDIGEVEQGSLVVFRNYIKNTGNAEDTFDITYQDNEFPAGSDFYLSHYIPREGETVNPNKLPDITLDDFDQRIPLIDTNGDKDGFVDTGIMQVDEEQVILLWVQLPLEALGTGIKLDKLGISEADPEVTDTARDECDIRTVKVDITNNRYLGEGSNANIGAGKGPEAGPVTEVTVNPGETGFLNLYVNNTAEYLTDEYKLEVSTDPTFKTIQVPDGIKVTLVSAQGAQITGTEEIKPGGHENIRAKIEVSETALSGDHFIYFKVMSAQTGAYDIKTDMIKVGVVRSLTILPKNEGVIYAGSSIVYPHTIKNGGNVLEGSGALSSKGLIKMTNTRPNHFSSTCYWDKDGNGLLEKGIDPQLADLAMDGIEGLEPGEEIDVFVEVYAAKTATVNMQCTTKIRLDVNKGVYKIFHPDVFTTDITTIMEDEVVIRKYQGTDTPTGLGPDNPADFIMDEQRANPGEYIYYRIVAENTGSTTISSVAVEDLVPQYTTLVYAPQNAFLSKHGGKPSWRYGHEDLSDMKITDKYPDEATFDAQGDYIGGGKGEIEVMVTELGPNDIVELYFAVKIDGELGDIEPDDDPEATPVAP